MPVYVFTIICRPWNLDVPVYVFTVISQVWSLDVPVCVFTLILYVGFGAWMSLFMYYSKWVWNLNVPVYVFMSGLEPGCPCLCIYNNMSDLEPGRDVPIYILQNFTMRLRYNYSSRAIK